MIYIQVNAKNEVTDMLDDKRDNIPTGYIQITKADHAKISKSRIGYENFMYVGGVLSKSKKRRDDFDKRMLLARRTDEAIEKATKLIISSKVSPTLAKMQSMTLAQLEAFDIDADLAKNP